MENKISAELTEIDLNILRIMQRDVGLPVADIAREAGVSPSSCWRRISRMEQEGVIRAKVALLNADALDLGVVVFVNVRLAAHSDQTLREFEEEVAAYPEVLECYTMTGTMDFLLKIVTRDIRGYEQFFRNHLANMPAVQEVHSSVAITQIKYSTQLPI